TWVRIASSVQTWGPDPLEARSVFGSGRARLQAIITDRKRGDIESVCFRSIGLLPRLHAGSDAYPGPFRSIGLSPRLRAGSDAYPGPFRSISFSPRLRAGSDARPGTSEEIF